MHNWPIIVKKQKYVTPNCFKYLRKTFVPHILCHLCWIRYQICEHLIAFHQCWVSGGILAGFVGLAYPNRSPVLENQADLESQVYFNRTTCVDESMTLHNEAENFLFNCKSHSSCPFMSCNIFYGYRLRPLKAVTHQKELASSIWGILSWASWGMFQPSFQTIPYCRKTT